MVFDIDGFFRVFTPTTLPDGTEVTVRVLSDVELKARESYSLSAVAQMAEALKNPEHDEYKNKIAPLDVATDASLSETLVSSWRDEWLREARELHRVQFFPYPEDATDEEKIKTDTKQRDHEQFVFAERAKYYLAREQRFREAVTSWDRDKLLRETKLRAIGLYALDMGLQEQIWWTLWKSVEKDGKPYWKSIGDVKTLPQRVIDVLMTCYREVDAQDPWALTKSEPARSPDGVDTQHPDGGSAGITVVTGT